MYRCSYVLREKGGNQEFPVVQTLEAPNDLEARARADDFGDLFGTLGLVVLKETIEEGSLEGMLFIAQRVVHSFSLV